MPVTPLIDKRLSWNVRTEEPAQHARNVLLRIHQRNIGIESGIRDAREVRHLPNVSLTRKNRKHKVLVHDEKHIRVRVKL